MAFKKTKHILRAANDLRDRVAHCIYTPQHVPSSAQLSDVLTKPLRPGAHAVALDALLGTAPDAPVDSSKEGGLGAAPDTPVDSSKEGVLDSSQEGVFRGDP